MSKTQPRKLYWRLFALSLILSCMAFLPTTPGESADVDCCIKQFNTCNSGCAPSCDSTGCTSDFPCETNCWTQYAVCTAPNGVCAGPLEPEEPCPGCAEGCDVMQQECVDSGGDPRSCVAAGVRCRRSCYVGCPQ